jgi:hypothetical protein
MFYEGFTATVGYHTANLVLFLGFAALVALWIIGYSFLEFIRRLVERITTAIAKLCRKFKGLIS